MGTVGLLGCWYGTLLGGVRPGVRVVEVEFQPGSPGAIGRFCELVQLAGGSTGVSSAAMEARRAGDDETVPLHVGVTVGGLTSVTVQAVVSLVREEFSEVRMKVVGSGS